MRVSEKPRTKLAIVRQEHAVRQARRVLHVRGQEDEKVLLALRRVGVGGEADGQLVQALTNLRVPDDVLHEDAALPS